MKKKERIENIMKKTIYYEDTFLDELKEYAPTSRWDAYCAKMFGKVECIDYDLATGKDETVEFIYYNGKVYI